MTTTHDENWEFGIRAEGHEAGSEGPVVLGEGDFRYEVSGLRLGNPAGGLDIQRGHLRGRGLK